MNVTKNILNKFLRGEVKSGRIPKSFYRRAKWWMRRNFFHQTSGFVNELLINVYDLAYWLYGDDGDKIVEGEYALTPKIYGRDKIIYDDIIRFAKTKDPDPYRYNDLVDKNVFKQWFHEFLRKIKLEVFDKYAKIRGRIYDKYLLEETMEDILKKVIKEGTHGHHLDAKEVAHILVSYKDFNIILVLHLNANGGVI